jgi:hypothetical protein
MSPLHVLSQLIFTGEPIVSQCSGTWATRLAAVEKKASAMPIVSLVGFIVAFEFVLGGEASGLTGTIFDFTSEWSSVLVHVSSR